MKETVLVTGASGFLGNNLVRDLLKKNELKWVFIFDQINSLFANAPDAKNWKIFLCLSFLLAVWRIQGLLRQLLQPRRITRFAYIESHQSFDESLSRRGRTWHIGSHATGTGTGSYWSRTFCDTWRWADRVESNIDESIDDDNNNNDDEEMNEDFAEEPEETLLVEKVRRTSVHIFVFGESWDVRSWHSGWSWSLFMETQGTKRLGSCEGLYYLLTAGDFDSIRAVWEIIYHERAQRCALHVSRSFPCYTRCIPDVTMGRTNASRRKVWRTAFDVCA